MASAGSALKQAKKAAARKMGVIFMASAGSALKQAKKATAPKMGVIFFKVDRKAK